MRKIFARRIGSLLLLLGAALTASGVAAQKSKCYDYERTDFSISGKIERVKANKNDTIWVLRLAKKACFDGGAADGVDVSEKDVAGLQLVLSAEEYQRYRAFVNKNVVVTGGFFHSHTAHHFTKVLLDVVRLEARR